MKIKLNGIDITQLKSLYITFKQGSKEITKTTEDIEMEDGNILSVFLSQEDTLNFLGGFVDVQLRAITYSEVVVASNIKGCP